MQDKGKESSGFRKMTVLCASLFSFFFSPALQAQFEHTLFTPNLNLETKVYYGFLYAQHLELEYYNAHFPSFEFSVEQQTWGHHRWERTYNYPIIGMTFFYSPLGGNASLGNAYALMPFVNFPIYKTGTFCFGFRFSLGAAYLTKHYDRVSNYKDIAIGSHINAAINLMFEARFRLSEYFTLTGGFSLQHFSNGSLKTPNYGLNSPALSLGLAFRPFVENRDIGDRYMAPTEPYSTIVRHWIEFDIGAALGYKNMTSQLGANYFVYHLFENTMIPVSRKSLFGMGIDISYDASHKKLLELSGNAGAGFFDILRPGVSVAYELMVGKLGFFTNLGIYISGKEKSNGPLYEKFCFQYKFTKNLFVHVLLKVHFGRADYIGWGMGYTFDKFYGRKTVK